MAQENNFSSDVRTNEASSHLSGNVETLLHGSCPKCHHWHDKVRIWLWHDPNEYNHIRCQRCQHKMFGLGGNSSHFSLLSRETVLSGSERSEFSVQYCTNQFTILAAVGGVAASALAAPAPTVANILDPQSTHYHTSEQLHDESDQSLDPGQADAQTTSPNEHTTQAIPDGQSEHGTSKTEPEPDASSTTRNEICRSGTRRFSRLRSKAKQMLSSLRFEVKVSVRRVPSNGSQARSRETESPLQAEEDVRTSNETANAPLAPTTPILSLPTNREPDVPNMRNSGVNLSAGAQSSETLKDTNQDGIVSGDQTPNAEEGQLDARCECPVEPTAREAWIKQRRRIMTMEEHQRFCKCTPSCDCYRIHHYQGGSDAVEASSVAPNSESEDKPESEASQSLSGLSNSAVNFSYLGEATRSPPRSPHDSIMSGSQHSHHQDRRSNPSERNSTRLTDSSDSLDRSSGSNRSRLNRTASMPIDGPTATLENSYMNTLDERQELIAQDQTQHRDEEVHGPHDAVETDGCHEPTKQDQDKNDDDDDMTPIATRNQPPWTLS